MSSEIEAIHLDDRVKSRALDDAPVGIVITNPHLDDNPIVYANRTFEQLTGYPRHEIVGRNCRFLQGPKTDPASVTAIRSAIAAGRSIEIELRNYRQDGEPFWNELRIEPIYDSNGSIIHFVGFQTDVTDRRMAEMARDRRATALEHLTNRTTGLLFDVTELLMHADSRRDYEQQICDRIASTSAYDAAWFAELDLASDTLVISSAAGTVESLVGRHIPTDGTSPAARVISRGGICIGDVDDDPIAQTALPEVQSVISASIEYAGRTYGALTIYTRTPDGFDEVEEVVIETIARTTATAINAAANRRRITDDDIVKLEFMIGDESFLPAALSRGIESTLTYQGSVHHENGLVSLFFDAAPAVPDVLDEMSHPDIQSIDLISVGGSSDLVACRLNGTSFVDELATYGVKTRSVVSEEGVATMVVEVARSDDPRALVEFLTSRYDPCQLTKYTDHERPPLTTSEFIESVHNQLTNRQRSALEMAYNSGYYDANRRVTGQQLADAMEVSRPTFHQHRRAGERKLIAAFLDQ